MVRKVDIRWSDEIDFLDIHRDSKWVQHYGLYMILETPFRAPGPARNRHSAKKLIYIGIVKSEARDFFMRMQEHKKKWIHDINRGDIFVKFGILYSHENITHQLIEDAESTLVFEHEPRENTSKKKSYTIEKDILVRNHNHGGYVDPSIRSTKHTG